MTKLSKAIQRETPILLDNRAEARARDQVVVTLYPNGTLGFRKKRCRREYVLSLAAAYRLAIEVEVRAEKAKKKAGMDAGGTGKRSAAARV